MGEEVKILIVDDRQENILLLEEILSNLGATFISALSGKEALKKIADYEFALAIFDVMMPDMDGFELTKEIHLDKRNEALPIIFITAQELDDDFVSKGYDLGAVDYLRKPIHPGIIKSKVKVFVELYKQRQDIRKEKDRAQQYLDTANVMFVGLDINFKISLMNKRGEEILGYTESEIIGKDWIDNFLPERLRKNVREVLEKLIKGNTEDIEYYENPILTKDGKERIISWHNTLLKDEFGQVIGTLGAGIDITERNAAEESEQEHREMLNHVMDTILTGIVIIDVKMRVIVDANPEACKMLGLTKKDVVGRKCVDLLCYSQEGICSALDFGEEINKTDRTLISSDGKNVPILKTVSTFFFKDREYIIDSFIDVSEQKCAEAAAAEVIEDLKQFKAAAIGRENKMIDLKKEANALLSELGRPSAHDLSFLDVGEVPEG